MSTDLFVNKVLTTSFQPSKPAIVTGGKIALDLVAVVTSALTSIELYLEYASQNPGAAATSWFREVAEEAAAGGAVAMPQVVRTLQANGGAALAVGTHNLSLQFERHHMFYRLQARIVSGGGNAVLTARDPLGATLNLDPNA